MSRRVVLTGAGLRTALGSTPADFFDAILAGRSGVRRMHEWEDVDQLQSLLGGPIDGFDERELPRKHRRSMGRVAMLAVLAARSAVRAAGLSPEQVQDRSTAVVMGSTTGSTAADDAFWRTFHSHGSARGIRATTFFKVMAHTCSTNVAMHLGITGETMSTNAACASATQALGVALDRIRNGRADVVLAGGADELHVGTAVTFDGMGGGSRNFNDRPHASPRPFDAQRDGIVCAEGGAVLVLEEREHALARGATILAELAGYGGTTDAANMAAPGPTGMSEAVRIALEDAGVTAEAVDYVNAHATGTPVGDATEAEALYGLFGDQVPVSSIKGHTGHLLGACGAAEVIACLEGIRRGVVPPTKNLEQADVSDLLLPTRPLRRELRCVVSTNFAFGGVNSAVVLRHPASA